MERAIVHFPNKTAVVAVNPTLIAEEQEKSEREECASIIKEAVLGQDIVTLVHLFCSTPWWKKVRQSFFPDHHHHTRLPVLEIVCEKRVDPDPAIPTSAWHIVVSSGTTGPSVDYALLGCTEQQCLQMFMAKGGTFFACKKRSVMGHTFHYHQFKYNALLAQSPISDGPFVEDPD